MRTGKSFDQRLKALECKNKNIKCPEAITPVVAVDSLPQNPTDGTLYFDKSTGKIISIDKNGNQIEYGKEDYAVYEYFKYDTGFKLENSDGVVKDIAAIEHHYVRVSNDIKTLSVSGSFYPQDDVLLKNIDIKFVGTYGKNRFKLFVAEVVDFNGAINAVTSLVPYLSTIYESPEFDVFGAQEKTFFHKSFDVGVQLNKGGTYIIYFRGLGLDNDGDYTRVYYGLSIDLTLKKL